MTTATTIRNPDGSYTVDGGYLIRKVVQADMYDPYRDLPAGLRTGHRKPPTPHGWVVEHPDFSYPQLVPTRAAGVELADRHRYGFWYSRAEEFAAAIDVDMDTASKTEIATMVCNAAVDHRLTTDDFIELDERPGQFGRINGKSCYSGHWYRNLRVARNSSPKLFDVLRANGAR